MRKQRWGIFSRFLSKGLHRGAWLFLLWILAWALQVEHRLAYPNLYLDTEVQAGAAYQLLAGNGLNWLQVDPQDWSQTKSQALDMFAPGYAYALAGMLCLLRDPYAAILGLDVLSLLLVFWGIKRVFNALRKDHSSVSVCLPLFLAFTLPPFHYLTGSGLWALAYLAIAWALLLDDWVGGDWLAWGCLWVAAYSRTAYLVLIPLLPTYWIAQGYFSNSKALSRQGAISLLLSLAWLMWEFVHPTAAGYQGAATARGFFPAQLLKVEPFALKAFMYYGLPHELQIKAWLPHIYPWFKVLAQIASLAILWLAWGMGLRAWRERKESPKPFQFALSLLFTSLAVLSLLGFQSLTIAAEDWNWIGYWTYLMEPRYYAPIMLGLVIWLFSQGKSKRWLTGLKLITLATLLVGLSLKGYRWGLGSVGTFYHSSSPALNKEAKQIKEEADLPMVLALPQGSQAGNLVGIPCLTDSSISKVAQGIPTRDSLLIGSPIDLFPDDSVWSRTEHLGFWLMLPDSNKSSDKEGL